jgi:2-oxo-3-hexenedioate decarboxylase
MKSPAECAAIAAALLRAYAEKQEIAPPSAQAGGFTLDDAYAVEGEIVGGRRPVGLKVGYANKAVWRALKLETLVWAHLYDDTVKYASGGAADLVLSGMYAPKIEPEIVFKLRSPLPAAQDAAEVLSHVEWLALGFEIIDCVFPGWQFQPADFVASKGLHAALVVGDPTAVTRENLVRLVEQLPAFKLRLMKNGELVEEGSGRNSLRSPALCLGELASALARRAGSRELEAGDLVSSGTLTTPAPIVAGEEWKAEVSGIELPPLTLRLRD